MLIISDRQIDMELEGAEIISLSDKKVGSCTGCYNCWIKSPGSCVIRDDQVMIYQKIAAATELVFVTRVKYGCYDVPMKIMIERCLPLFQAFLKIHKEETRHEHRQIEEKDFLVLAYGAENQAEKDIFSYLVERNANNMSFNSYKVSFVEESLLEETLKKEVSLEWRK